QRIDTDRAEAQRAVDHAAELAAAAEQDAQQRIAEHTAARDEADRRAARAEHTADTAQQQLTETKTALHQARQDTTAAREELAALRREHTAELDRLRTEHQQRLREERDTAAARLAAVDDAREQSRARAERAEAQLDVLTDQLRATRTTDHGDPKPASP
ncbi:hypothetical protein, partial [Saccharopolyspora cebuensis]|uniref:hypothetical protein n=1 Tax=Saccharopolyspora cebuensis TaxID=418759 RepID=UPI003CD05A93